MLQDSDAANSYLINSLLHTIPNQVETLGRLRGKGSGIIAAKALTIKNKLLITSLAQTQNAKKLAKDMNYLFNINTKLKQQLSSQYQEAQQLLNRYLTLADQEIVSATKPSINADDFFNQGTTTITALLNLFDRMQPLLEERMQKQIDNAKSTIYIYFALIIIVTLLLVYIYIGIYMAIRNNLNEMMKSADAICEGNLNRKLNLATKDELQLISTGINEIVDGISRSIFAINKSSDEIAHTSDEIAQESNNTAQGMITQSQELEQVSTAITQMSASINEVAQNTELGTNSAQLANKKVDHGSQVVQQTVSSINLLAENIEQAAVGVNTLKENSNNITNILDVIKGIADQTNLLALNAAIEAARAGEQGRGFAVVADEVRTLAQRTQDSTLEIHNMIELIQHGISDVANAMNESQGCAKEAVECSVQAGEVLSEINNSVTEITDMSSQIAAAVEEQSVVSEEISKSIINISDVATDSARGAKILAEAGAKLSAMSKEMRITIQRYQIDESNFEKNAALVNLLAWQNKFNIGIDEADRQHKKMLDMMNDVHIMSVNKRSNQAIAQALNALIAYTEMHFTWEEGLFSSYGYPQTEQHHNIHNKLLDDIRLHQKNIETGNEQQIKRELESLNEWLIKHIEYSDRDYAKFLKEKGFTNTNKK
jgi:hemerythrin-like metal-binding protein